MKEVLETIQKVNDARKEKLRIYNDRFSGGLGYTYEDEEAVRAIFEKEVKTLYSLIKSNVGSSEEGYKKHVALTVNGFNITIEDLEKLEEKSLIALFEHKDDWKDLCYTGLCVHSKKDLLELFYWKGAFNLTNLETPHIKGGQAYTIRYLLSNFTYHKMTDVLRDIFDKAENKLTPLKIIYKDLFDLNGGNIFHLDASNKNSVFDIKDVVNIDENYMIFVCSTILEVLKAVDSTVGMQLLKSTDNDGNTPLHIAVVNNAHKKIIDASGINIRELMLLKNNKGETPLDLAKNQPVVLSDIIARMEADEKFENFQTAVLLARAKDGNDRSIDKFPMDAMRLIYNYSIKLHAKSNYTLDDFTQKQAEDAARSAATTVLQNTNIAPLAPVTTSASTAATIAATPQTGNKYAYFAGAAAVLAASSIAYCLSTQTNQAERS